jgi:small-conductance mechanosensitive channel
MVRILRRVFSRVFEKTGAISDPTARGLVSRIASTGVWGIVGFTTLGTLGIDTSPALATLGVTGATVGFACKDIGANLAAGAALAFQRPFAHGTRVRVGTASTGIEGVVDHWDMRYLYLKAEDGSIIHIPNTTVFTSILTIPSADIPRSTLEDRSDDYGEPTPQPKSPTK